MWQISNAIGLLFWDGWHFIAREGKGGEKKCCMLDPLPTEKCVEKLLRVWAVERLTCLKTTRRHAGTQVCSLQLLTGRQMSEALQLIWITLAHPGKLLPTNWHTVSPDDSLLRHRECCWLTKRDRFGNGDVSLQLCGLTKIRQTNNKIAETYSNNSTT